jgi:hypothetical protein
VKEPATSTECRSGPGQEVSSASWAYGVGAEAEGLVPDDWCVAYDETVRAPPKRMVRDYLATLRANLSLPDASVSALNICIGHAVTRTTRAVTRCVGIMVASAGPGLGLRVLSPALAAAPVTDGQTDAQALGPQ